HRIHTHTRPHLVLDTTRLSRISTPANHGVAHRLAAILTGSSALVTAYASATSTTTRYLGSLWPSAIISSPSSTPPSISVRRASPPSPPPNPNHSFLRKYRSNLPAPSATYPPHSSASRLSAQPPPPQ